MMTAVIVKMEFLTWVAVAIAVCLLLIWKAR